MYQQNSESIRHSAERINSFSTGLLEDAIAKDTKIAQLEKQNAILVADQKRATAILNQYEKQWRKENDS